jgi:pyruvate formate lyase activating enzyme
MMRKEALLYRKMEGGAVECRTCARLCRIREGGRGFCFVRENAGGKLYLMNYGVMSSIQVDPIEKKPFNHFMPGVSVLSMGTVSCNFGCPFCLNHNISKVMEMAGEYVSPERAVEMALRSGSQGIAFTYNEPTIFLEYALDVAKEAHGHGLFNVFVTNGFMTREAVGEMKGLIDAAVVNFKGSGERGFASKYELVTSNDPIKESLLAMKDAGIHIELTDLVIPRIGDSLEACRELTEWAFANLGPDTPMHFLRFHPDYKVLDIPPTAYDDLKRHYDMAKASGLRYVYVGNFPGSPYESTYCPNCGQLAIGRSSMSITQWNLDAQMRCTKCRHKLAITGSPRARP